MQVQKKQEPLRLQDVLSQVSELEIYERLSPGIKLNERNTKAPYRHDKSSGSFGIYQSSSGRIMWKDFSGDIGGGVIDLVERVYNTDFKGALQRIAMEFRLTDRIENSAQVVRQYEKVEIEKRKCLIQVSVCPYREQDKLWWGKYLITPEMLLNDKIRPITELYINRQKFPIEKGEKAYVYNRGEAGLKVYLCERQGADKWKQNIPQALVENEQVLERATKVLITKSTKDRLCLSALFPGLAIISVQNESICAYQDKLMEKLQGKQVWINYDRDQAGKQASLRVNAKFPWMRHINVPDCYEQKDFADMVRDGMREKVIEHFIKKGLWNK